MPREHRAATRRSNAQLLGRAARRTVNRNVLVEGLENRLLLSTYVVNTTADSGTGSLRSQMITANFHAGADTITFSFRTRGVHSIHLLSGLPGIIDPLTINGNISGNILGTVKPGIELDGSGLGAGENGMGIYGDNSTITGLIINRF